MIEIFPKKVSPEKVQASLQKLVAAFLLVAEDLAKEDKPPAIKSLEVKNQPVNF